VLLAAQKRLKQAGGAVFLSALRPEIRKVFDIAGFNRLFSIYPSLEEALGAGQGR
jgi:anti-sigma B factor antagonist